MHGSPPLRSAAALRHFPCLADRAARATMGVRLVVVALHAVLVGVLFLLNADLIRSSRDRPWYITSYLVLIMTTLVQYFFTSYSSPGYVLDAVRRGSDTPNLDVCSSSVCFHNQAVPRIEDPNPLSQISILWTKHVAELYPPETFSSLHVQDTALCVINVFFNLIIIVGGLEHASEEETIPNFGGSSWRRPPCVGGLDFCTFLS